ncbi:dITP/XTP pyrophosphatase [bioreactor metagenome]|jgi:XTP/dITP diphosphohydrolase|uniref:dITP/XTP pyrophosphatase n=1 Tax=bioreactor metagenome TaxID=1076179 RepID=A0A644UTL7_9ZZZZ|nr:non-canonical purine NTP diphosphatase [Lentimicrobium sp.]MEA5109840.1 non-canonical purine NTP diphosphatase [Lentimicrobium sp.]
MKSLVFATNNRHKLEEVSSILSGKYHLTTLNGINCHEDIPETSDTIEGNALMKARYVVEHYGYDCFADDTGLEVDALDGRPGVYSARYAGEGCSYDENVAKLLDELNGQTNRKARFKTVIALIMGGKVHLFEGVLNGNITHERRGTSGFGYDPVFIPHGYDQTFAEMPPALKNTISHRALAVNKLAEFLK